MYIPRPSDIAWTRDFLATLNDKAIWTVPMNGNRYVKDDSTKTLWLVAGDDLDLLEKLNINCQAAAGWSAQVATPEIARAYVETTQMQVTEGQGKAIHSLAIQQFCSEGMIAYARGQTPSWVAKDEWIDRNRGMDSTSNN